MPPRPDVTRDPDLWHIPRHHTAELMALVRQTARTYLTVNRAKYGDRCMTAEELARALDDPLEALGRSDYGPIVHAAVAEYRRTMRPATKWKGRAFLRWFSGYLAQLAEWDHLDDSFGYRAIRKRRPLLQAKAVARQLGRLGLGVEELLQYLRWRTELTIALGAEATCYNRPFTDEAYTYLTEGD